MGADSKIEWCDHTFNPWVGCTKVSEGCAHCYAAVSTRARVLRSRGQETWGKGAQRALTSESYWRQPVLWNKRADRQRLRDGQVLRCWGTTETAGEPETRMMQIEGPDGFTGEMTPATWETLPRHRPRVFCASLADWLDEEVPVMWLHRLLKLVFATPNLDWLLLTKRPQNWRERIERCLVLENGGDPVLDYQDYFEKNDGLMPHTCFGHWLNDWTGDTPPANVWVGATVENQARAEVRIPALLKIPAQVRFLSCEPLLGAVDLSKPVSLNEARELQWRGIDWVIAGGESGPGARPMHPDWARSLRDQCAAAEVPFLFKQWGEWLPDPGELAEGLPGKKQPELLVFHPPGNAAAGLAKVGKKKAGRVLDGREWNGFPRGKEVR